MTTNFTQTSVGELRQLLIDSGKYTAEQADAIKGKANLVEAVIALNATDENDIDEVPLPFSQMVIVPTEEIVGNPAEGPVDMQSIPDYNSVDWHDYVMQQFHEKELQDGKYPKVDGLRRVAQLLIGEIIETGPTFVSPPTKPDIPDRATVTYIVRFRDEYGIEKTFSSVAGAWIGNTDDEYAVFPEAIAETRAEARALRRALRLRIVSAEELTNKDTKQVVKDIEGKASTGEWQESGNISSTQINFIKNVCAKLGIDVDKFIATGKVKYESINDIPKETAMAMIKTLNEYQSSTKTSLVIPEDIKLPSGN